MSNLPLARFVRPIDSWNMGPYLREYLTHSTTFPQVLFPSHLRESEGHSPEAWSRGWPLVTAKRAPSPSAESWREDQNASQCMVLILSLRIRRPPGPRHAVLGLSPAR
jgi:hypothetical protein